MTNIIVVFPKIEDAKNIKNLLMRNGVQVTVVCNSGAQALSYADEFHNGIIISGYRLKDMMYTDLLVDLPRGFSLLLITSNLHVEEASQMGVMCVSMPVKIQHLVQTIFMMSEEIERARRRRKEKPVKRSSEDRQVIETAKELLIERNHMTEQEAHRYIQKCSMDSGTGMVESAKMILSIYR
ncbi:Ethanolamine two-component response regulator [Lachnospiraceae bacterium TWA4]|nr:Ethanolamine two-component response regulator [Lachnospiraceae bacterium TWA4]